MKSVHTNSETDSKVHSNSPLSSTAPTIIENADGSLRAVLGGSGGSRIFPSIVQVIVNLECGDNLSEAIERPRIHDQVVPAVTTIEVGPEGLDGELKADLESRGHVVGEFDINIGVSEGEFLAAHRSTDRSHDGFQQFELYFKLTFHFSSSCLDSEWNYLCFE